ncbi:MAG: deoxyguanosinetriphosphate triphosphohydrolase [Candidatus Zixiibacteriota bacterium]
MSHYLTREEIEQWELQYLAPYAARSVRSSGRAYPQQEHHLRTAYQRDRDRIIHSAAFRRLEYKTQVFIPHEKDHYRTRLTHTIEVAQISRTIARSLRLNEDLAEAIALAHDLGHTPFGHAGEEVLDKLMQDSGGFNHNRQSLRVVDILEQRYPQHPGLNLSFEVREGIVKHETSAKIATEEFNPYQQATLEASLVDIADEIAYNSHDIDDGLSSGLVTLDDLNKAAFWKHFQFDADRRLAVLPADQKRYMLVRRLVDCLVTDVIAETQARINRLRITDLSSVRNCHEKICSYSEQIQQIVRDTKEFLHKTLYRHPRLVAKSDQTRRIIETLFVRFRKSPELLPPRFQTMLAGEAPEIVIADYIAGMTDRYAEKVYHELA